MTNVDRGDSAESRDSTVELCTTEDAKSGSVSAAESVSKFPFEGSLTAWLRLLRIGSLLFLTLQYASFVLLMRYARIRSGYDMFMATTAVVVAEVLKVAVCLVGILCEQRFNLFAFGNYLLSNTVQRPTDCLKISVPATIYMLQSNLVYVALSNLDTMVFLITNQLKIFTTAVFSVLILRKQLSWVQWFALGLLIVGVSTVQMHGNVEQNRTNSTLFTANEKKNVSEISSTEPRRDRKENFALGILAVLAACLMSGFAGVYYEKLLKNTPPSICLRNVQLGSIGVVFGVMAAWYIDGTKIAAKGFFHGYDVIVWGIVVLQSIGGLLIGVAVKYADNIEKGFATSAAIVVTCIVSVFEFSLDLSLPLCFGVVLVIASTYIYARFLYVPFK